MARNKEAVVCVLDVGSSMGESLGPAKKAVELLVQQKILHSAKDQIGLVLFGCDDTENELNEELGGYEHVKVTRNLDVPTVDLLRAIPAIAGGSVDGDCIDALLVGLDMLKKQSAKAKSTKRRIFLVTAAAGAIEDADQMPMIVQQLREMDCKLDVVGVDFGDDNARAAGKSATKRANEELLQQACEGCQGTVLPVSHAVEMLSSLRSKAVKQTSKFRGVLEVTPELSIPVWSIGKIAEAKLPSLSKLSVPALEAGGDSCKVKMDRVYRSQTAANREVPADERMKGFKYGTQLVPFGPADEAAMKYTCDRCLKTIAFIDRSKARRHHYMGVVDAIVAQPGDETAFAGLSALIHALDETNRCIVARYVKRANSVPQLALLTPYIAAKDPHTQDPADYECLYLNQLPFADDLRAYQFNNFNDDDNFKPSLVQLAAAEELITGLDLMTAQVDAAGNVTEALRPERTFNPVLQRFYQALQARALEPDCPVPPLDPEIEAFVTPDAALFEKGERVVKAFRANFEFKKNEVKKKRKRRFWGDEIGGEEETKGQPAAAKKPRAGDDDIDDDDLDAGDLFSDGPADVVGSVDPVKDFNSMIARRDGDYVAKAVEGIKAQIKRFVDDGGTAAHFAKAIECLRTMRAGCLSNYEEAAFNDFMKALKAEYESGPREAFWQILVATRISLIHNEECPSASVSHVTKAEADRFLDPSAAPPPAAPAPEPVEDEGEDMFEDMD